MRTIKTDKQILAIAKRINAMHEKIYELATQIEESEHPKGKEIYDDLHMNGVFSYAYALGIVEDALGIERDC